MTKAELVILVVKALPYAEQMKDLDLDTEGKAIRFTWRGERFRVSASLSVESVEPSVLVGSNIALLLEALLKRVAMETTVADVAASVFVMSSAEETK